MRRLGLVHTGVHGQTLDDDHILFSHVDGHGDVTSPLKILIEAIPTAMFVVEQTSRSPVDWTVIALNHLHASLTGLKDEVGQPMSSWCPRETRVLLFENYGLATDTWEQVSYVEELDLPSGMGWWSTSLMPIRTRSGVVRIVGSAKDISHSRITEQALATFLPMCSVCKSVRVEETNDPSHAEGWVSIEDYLKDHQISHGFCPACFERLYGHLKL
ncbi:hypothetical protein TRICHSKD4_3617 [Roseibium sp. TrichSKD4]|uniref:hypothetical protein n=1 Tax=Roseibium sp. TrichSKD4 TaxID=744980 RepID=UPI0001E56A10|nr:hypothetical protein [Roseibium sp. TrichSKD4]EFO31093.1 hypothetical protein TRICHSKD4_3617 [Roseibium sp. TrichSKD4]